MMITFGGSPTGVAMVVRREKSIRSLSPPDSWPNFGNTCLSL